MVQRLARDRFQLDLNNLPRPKISVGLATSLFKLMVPRGAQVRVAQIAQTFASRPHEPQQFRRLEHTALVAATGNHNVAHRAARMTSRAGYAIQRPDWMVPSIRQSGAGGNSGTSRSVGSSGLWHGSDSALAAVSFSKGGCRAEGLARSTQRRQIGGHEPPSVPWVQPLTRRWQNPHVFNCSHLPQFAL